MGGLVVGGASSLPGSSGMNPAMTPFQHQQAGGGLYASSTTPNPYGMNPSTSLGLGTPGVGFQSPGQFGATGLNSSFSSVGDGSNKRNAKSKKR